MGKREKRIKRRLLDVILDPSVEEWKTVEVGGYEVLLFKTKGEEGYSVVVPALPGCCSQGETEEEALHNIEEAIELFKEVLEEEKRR